MNSPGVSSAGSTCCSEIAPAVDVRAAGRRCSCSQRESSVCGLSSNTNSAARWPRRAAAARELRRQRRLAGARRRRRSACWCLPRCRRRAARRAPGCRSASFARVVACRCSAATRRGNTSMPALLDHVVVIAAAELHAAILDDAQPAALRAVLGIELLEQHDAVRDALHLQVVIGRGQVVEQHHRALPRRRRTA